jgi:hypothetical protein
LADGLIKIPSNSWFPASDFKACDMTTLPEGFDVKNRQGKCQRAEYFSKALGLGQLAKEHGYKLIPGSEPLRVPLDLVFRSNPMKFNSTEQSNQLTKQACM